MNSMIKALFLYYSFGDYDLNLLRSVSANCLIVAGEPLTEARWYDLKTLRATLDISVTAFPDDLCVLNPKAKKFFEDKLKRAITYQPQILWLDHFRFNGHWETAEAGRVPQTHPECEYCKGKDRVEILCELAKRARQQVPNEIKLGYFAVPLYQQECPQILTDLGQDHQKLAPFFDVISPMLYHRMINKSVEYVGEYTRYLDDLTGKPILPIIQVKDMPNDLEDKLTEAEMSVAYRLAKEASNIGVCWFAWDEAVETSKTEIIKTLFAS